MKKYEYKTFQNALSDTELNRLGEQGWELVAHTAFGSGMGQYYVFKREKQ